MKRIFIVAFVALMSFSCGPKYMKPQGNEGSEVNFFLKFSETVFRVTDAGENVCISPYSAGVALSMLAEGAENQTRAEFLSVLDSCIFGKKDLGDNDTVIVKSANSLWIDNDFAIRNKYVDLLSKDFGAFATALDFGDPSTVQALNNWCEENTDGKITDMVKELSPQTPLVIANALYFKAPWETPFPEHSTGKRFFNGTSGKSEVDFMNQTGVFRYAAHQGNVMVQMPYQGGRYAMTLIMPSESGHLADMFPYFNESSISQAFGYMQEQRIRLSVPKFKMEYGINLNETLKKMGLASAFTGSADFKAIALGPLTLSSVVQKSFIEVNEKGSEAAAVTMAMVALTAAPSRQIEHVIFDRPFYFMISDLTDGTILFAGRISNL